MALSLSGPGQAGPRGLRGPGSHGRVRAGATRAMAAASHGDGPSLAAGPEPAASQSHASESV